jgi:exodeoxyribonuclease-3
MKIVTWNVNSIRVRLERLLAFLERENPDVVCLQELKVVDDDFPVDAISAAGYHSAVFGQKTYNGVAILSLEEPANVTKSFGDDVDDPQSRVIKASVNGVDIVSVYVPNGNQVGSDKWLYKLDWYKRLGSYIDSNWNPSDNLVVCGDFNVAPTDDDVAMVDLWGDSVLCHEDARAALQEIVDWGFDDLLREKNPGVEGPLTWWDYRMLGFPKNNGLRIDHHLGTGAMAVRCSAARVDRDERKGTKPSDHAPVIAEFD